MSRSNARKNVGALNGIVSALEFGAFGDGDSHPISSKYASLAAAQVDYPFATALTNEFDWCGIQAAINSVEEKGIVFIPAGIYICDQTIVIEDTEADGGPRVYNDDHFITLQGAGQSATWIMHTGAQTTGCVQILGSLFYTAGGGSPYYGLLNNGQSSVCDMALISAGGPALYLKFANKMIHRNLSLASYAVNSWSLLIESSMESYFDNIFTDFGNAVVPTEVTTAQTTHLPGAVTPKGNIFMNPITYDDGVHGVYPVAGVLEMFFRNCRSDGQSTDNSVDIRGYADPAYAAYSGTGYIYFHHCKFTSTNQTLDGSGTPNKWVVNINGASPSFNSCSIEGSKIGSVGGGVRVSSTLGQSAGVYMKNCIGETSCCIDVGIYGAAGDAAPLSLDLQDSNFYRVRVSTNAIAGGYVKKLVMKNNYFAEAGMSNDGSFANLYINGVDPVVTDVPIYDVSGNTYGASIPCLYQTNNVNPSFDYPAIRGYALFVPTSQIAAASAPVNTLFVDSGTGVLNYKDAAGVANPLY